MPSPSPASLSLLAPGSRPVAAEEPFPHLIRLPAIPTDVYQDLAASFPEPQLILGHRDGSMNNAAARLPHFKVQDNPEIAALWRDFFGYHSSAAFWLDVLAVFGPSFRQRFPMAETMAGKAFEDWRIAPRGVDKSADAWIDCQFVINTAVTKSISVKTPHVDKRDTMFSGLFYLRDPRDDSSGGNLTLYKWQRDPRFLKHRMILPHDVAEVRTINYDANLFVGFVNDPTAAHAVSPRSITNVPRRYINLIVETRFKLFELPPVNRWVQVWHWRAVRNAGYRSVGGDRA